MIRHSYGDDSYITVIGVRCSGEFGVEVGILVFQVCVSDTESFIAVNVYVNRLFFCKQVCESVHFSKIGTTTD